MLSSRSLGLVLLLGLCCPLATSEGLTNGIHLLGLESAATSSDQSRMRFPNGIYFSIANRELSGVLGQLDYARRLSEYRTVRLGFSFGLAADDLATTTTLGLVVEDLEYLGNGPLRPYVGLGIQLGGSSLGSAAESRRLWAVRIPFGLEYTVADYFSVGLESSLASTSHLSPSWNLTQFTFGFGIPALYVSLWFA